MLGVSTYFKTFDKDYLEQAAKLGAKYVFTSLHIPEDDLSSVPTRLPELLAICRQYDLALVPDISPQAFVSLKLPAGDFKSLKAMGLTALRLDYGFNDWALLKQLQVDFTLFLNASTIDEQYLHDAVANGIDLAAVHAAHNFYPKLETGLAKDYFANLNEKFKQTNINVLAFVPGDKLKRFPLYQGLPTIESHRGQNPYVSAVELIHNFGIDDIVVGDTMAKQTTLKYIAKYQSEKVMTLPLISSVNKPELFAKPLAIRRDISEKLVRVISPRISGIDIQQTGNQPLGTVSQDNQLNGRYSGEIQIAKTALPFTEKANILGYIHPEYLPLLQYIDGNTKIQFIEV